MSLRGPLLFKPLCFWICMDPRRKYEVWKCLQRFFHTPSPAISRCTWMGGGRGRGVSRVVSEGIVTHRTRLSKGVGFFRTPRKDSALHAYENAAGLLWSHIWERSSGISLPCNLPGLKAKTATHSLLKRPCGWVAASRGFLRVMYRGHVPDNEHCCSTTGWQKGRDTGCTFPTLAEQMGFVIDHRACRWLEQEKPPATLTDKLRNSWCQPAM